MSRIEITVKDLMSSPVITIEPHQTLREATALMIKKDIGSLPVMERNRLVGIITERDPVKASCEHGDVRLLKVRDIMSKPVITCGPNIGILELVNLMIKHRIHHVPVVDKGKLVGIVSSADLALYGIPIVDRLKRVPISAKARDIMTKKVLTINYDETIREAAKIMEDKKIGSLPVFKGKRMIGIITESDVRKAVVKGLDVDKATVREVMSAPVITCSPDTSMLDLVITMQLKGVRHLPVIDEAGDLVGIVSSWDLALYGAPIAPGKRIIVSR